MTIDMSDFDRWAASILRVDKGVRLNVPMRLVAKTKKGQTWLDARGHTDFIKDHLLQFVKEKMLAKNELLHKEFHKRANSGQDYYPMYRPKDTDYKKSEAVGERHRKAAMLANQMETSSDIEESREAMIEENGSFEDSADYGGSAEYKLGNRKPWVDMGHGFAKLWSAIVLNPQAWVQGSVVYVGVGHGDAIRSLKLSDYTKLSGMQAPSREYNSLFMAVELGTGTAANLGSEKWVRRGPSPNKTKEPDGTWWLNGFREVGEGALFEGQRGFHFLYDARTREPRDIYATMIRQKLPEYISEALGDGRVGHVGVEMGI